MDIINLTSRTPADPDPEGWMDMSPEERKKWIREHNPEEVEREKAQRKAMDELRQRIKEGEANISPEAKECLDAMQGRGYEDPIHDLREEIRQGIITRYNLREEIKALEKTNPGEQTRLLREERERNADYSKWHSPLPRLDDLKEDLAECEMMLKLNQDQLRELIAQRNVPLLLQEQRQIAFCLRLLYKFTADESVRQDIEAKTRARAAEWDEWKKSGNPKSYVQLADGIRQTLKVYEEMCNTYAKMPTSKGFMQKLEVLFTDQTKTMTDKVQKSAKQGAKQGGAEFMREFAANPNLQETGRQRKPGGGAKRKWDTNGAQCQALWDIVQGKTYETPSAAADAVIRRGCQKSINPFVYTEGMTADDKNKTRTKLVKRFKGWCRNNGKHYPFNATE